MDTTEAKSKQLKNTDRNDIEHMELDIDDFAEGIVFKDYLKMI